MKPIPRPGDLPLMLRAVFELGLARARLGRQDAASLLASASAPPPPPTAEAPSALVERIAWVVPRVAARLPWRSDCLVQATAAQRWLGSAGIPTRLFIGVRKESAALEAHAWLCHGDRVVTGGDISGFKPFVLPDAG